MPPRDVRAIGGRTPFAGVTIANLSPALSEELNWRGADEGVIVLEVGSSSRVTKSLPVSLDELDRVEVERTRNRWRFVARFVDARDVMVSTRDAELARRLELALRKLLRRRDIAVVQRGGPEWA